MVVRSVHTTSAVAPAESFDLWRHLISDTFVPLTADRVGDWDTDGRISHARYTGLDVSTVRAGGQRVRRTPRMISRSAEAYLLASIQTAGHGLIVQDGREALLRAGDIAFYDSSRPYTLHFDAEFEQIVVQMPLTDVATLSGVRDLAPLTARTLPKSSAARAVTDFFCSFTSSQDGDPDGAEVLAPSARLLLASALAVSDGSTPADDGRALRRTRVVEIMQRRLPEPTLGIDDIAAELHVSRRTLYRDAGDEAGAIMGQLRRMRIERARHLLTANPSMSIVAVGVACGFGGPVQFHRVFRQETGTTPAAFRAEGTPR